MTKMIFTGFSPNTESQDVRLAFNLLFSPWQWIKGTGVPQLEKTFCKYLSLSHSFSFASGRTALFAILSALDLQPHDEVLLQAYTCVAVPCPILWAGLKPVYVDCQETSFNMDPDDLEKRLTPKSKVLIVQHTFGHPADLDRLLAIAQKHHLHVIEDCAHALGAEYAGKKVGTFGHSAFFSFGRDKVISSVCGGMAVTPDPALAEKLYRRQKSWSVPPRWWVMQQLLHPLVVTLAKVTYHWGPFGKIIFLIAQRLRLISKTVYRVERKGGKPPFFAWQMPNALALLALKQFERLAHFNARRLEIAHQYSEQLKHCKVTLPTFLPQANSIHLRYTLRVPDTIPLMQAAKAQDILLGDWYTTAVAPPDVSYSSIGFLPDQYPIAQKLSVESINLPTHIQLSNDDVERVIHFLKNRYESIDS